MRKRVAAITLLCLLVVQATRERVPQPAPITLSPLPVSLPSESTGTDSGARGLTLNFLGDLMVHEENTRSRPYSEAFRMVADELGAGDLTFANMEFVLDETRPPSSYPRFNAPADYVAAAVAAGIKVWSVANNHSFDYGARGIEQTLSAITRYAEAYDVVASGLVADPKDRFSIELIESGGWKIGFLAVTAFLNQGAGSDHVNVIDYRSNDDARLLAEIISTNRDRFDLLILSYHGGIEYAPDPAPEKFALFSLMIDSGIDIVWAHHPHVLQPWGVYRGARRTGFIMSSLGNFISGQSFYLDPRWIDDPRAPRGESVIMKVHYSSTLDLESIEPIPVVHLRDADGIVRVVPIAELADVPLDDAFRRFYTARAERLALYVENQEISDRL